MQTFWLPSETAIEFSVPRHLANARLALYWQIKGEDLMVIFPARGEEASFRAALAALPRQLGGRPLFTGIADLTNQSRIDWHCRHYDFTTPPEIQDRMRQALFGI